MEACSISGRVSIESARAVAFDLSIPPPPRWSTMKGTRPLLHACIPVPRTNREFLFPIGGHPCIYWLSNSSIRTPVRLMSSRYFKFSQDICSVAVYLNDDDVLDRTCGGGKRRQGLVDRNLFFSLFPFFLPFFLFLFAITFFPLWERNVARRGREKVDRFPIRVVAYRRGQQIRCVIFHLFFNFLCIIIVVMGL